MSAHMQLESCQSQQMEASGPKPKLKPKPHRLVMQITAAQLVSPLTLKSCREGGWNYLY